MSVIHTQLSDCLSRIDQEQNIYVAYSGGIDSTALLHATKNICAATGQLIKAIHVNHQIHHDSILWSQHCIDQCRRMNIEIKNISVDVKQYNHMGIEGAAREARYQAFEKCLTTDDVLLTAHHADDQFETLLLQLFRGAGVHGLAACASCRELGRSLLMRPLLQVSRAQIEHYVQQYQLTWLEDPSNQSLTHDRNYLRHEVLPLLHARWHNLHEVAVRVTQWQSEAASMLDQLADADLHSALDENHRLDINRIYTLEYLHQKNLLRRWIRLQNCNMPNSGILARIVYEVMHSREDAQACVEWQGNEVRKFRGKLYLLKNFPNHDASLTFEWNLNEILNLPSLNISLSRQALSQQGVEFNNINNVQVCFRQGGEVMRPRGRGCQKELKTLFQEAGVAPWLRDRIPLLYYQGQLIYVWGYWINEGY